MEDIKPLIGNAFVDPDRTGEAVVDAVNRRGRSGQSAGDLRRRSGLPMVRRTERCC